MKYRKAQAIVRTDGRAYEFHDEIGPFTLLATADRDFIIVRGFRTFADGTVDWEDESKRYTFWAAADDDMTARYNTQTLFDVGVNLADIRAELTYREGRTSDEPDYKNPNTQDFSKHQLAEVVRYREEQEPQPNYVVTGQNGNDFFITRRDGKRAVVHVPSKEEENEN